ncbi:hypothetical protein EUGRSUZ_C04323 [Eucalyptus grandis]|uniref:Uncharacterized protein n=2 Tax=Eucalyptus grandis TaxID=71139 RepID=A0ACC3LKU0_EUCGR|nr:hypothetical protein EUGRSUZ_C04323 [Eucalyptus grandis]
MEIADPCQLQLAIEEQTISPFHSEYSIAVSFLQVKFQYYVQQVQARMLFPFLICPYMWRLQTSREVIADKFIGHV